MSLVSIIVPTYKRDKDLYRALSSLALQNHTDIEIILVDDNGNEERNSKVFAIAESIRQEYPSIVLHLIVNSSNQGSAKARNIGIKACNGDYVTFLDDDDVYMPNKVKLQVEFMESGGFDYSVTDLVLYNENDKEIDRRTRDYIKDTSPESLFVYHLKYHITGTDTMMFTKQYLTKIGGFAPIDVGDEFYLMQRAIEGGGKFGYLLGCEVRAYVHAGEGGLSSGDGKVQGENALYEYKKTYFDKLDSKTKRYIRMRHYAVIAYAEIRRKCYFAFVRNVFISFACAPVACVKMVLLER